MYRRKTIEKWRYDAVKVLMVFGFTSMLPTWLAKAIAVEFVSPVPDPIILERVETREVVVTPQNLDIWVDEAVSHYFTGDPVRQSEVKMIMHCLLHRETKHGLSKGHGDSGKAGGPLQFWNPTWDAYRKIMIARGEADKVGSRYNMKEAIWTTVWAIEDGRAGAWGPINRDMNGSDYASCPTPSWY
jgi:hypothetical protein